ncbi:MAG: hypothetical protein ACI9V8_000814 [Urechidicola sp.]|jgi:hypothetical protein
MHELDFLSEYEYQMLNEMRMMMNAKNWNVA